MEKEGDRVKIHSKKRIFSLGSILNPKEEPAKITVFVPGIGAQGGRFSTVREILKPYSAYPIIGRSIRSSNKPETFVRKILEKSDIVCYWTKRRHKSYGFRKEYI